MMLYGNGKYHVLTSPDLLHWTDEKKPIDNCFECPDLFQLPIDGDKTKMQWVLIQGNGNYSLGNFDGKSFQETSGRRPCDVGPNFYATQTWENASRRVQTAWMRGSDFPNMPFNQQISFPCELTLRTTSAGPRLFRQPISEISKLHAGQKAWRNQELNDGQSMALEASRDLLRIKADVIIPAKSRLVFKLRGIPVVLTSKTVESGSKPVEVLNEVQSVEILMDRGSIETFVNKGEVSSTRFMLPKEDGVTVSAEGGPVTIRSLTVYRLKSAWGKVKKD
jgi:levanase/fructan beta-fructosidase